MDTAVAKRADVNCTADTTSPDTITPVMPRTPKELGIKRSDPIQVGTNAGRLNIRA